MYANRMLIILPNEMSCCWQERAEGGKERRNEMEIRNESKYPSRVKNMYVFRHKLFTFFYYIFILAHLMNSGV